MKYLKLIPILFILFLFNANNAIAQDKEGKLTDEQKMQVVKDAKAFQEKLELTEAQKPTYKEITKRYAGELKAVKESDGGKLSKYKKLKATIAAKNAEMEKLLTKTQYKAYLEHQEENMDKMKEARKNK